MQKKILTRKIVLCVLLVFAVSLALLYFTKSELMVNPFETFAYDGTVSAAVDENGDTLIADTAGTRLLKVSPDGVLIWKVESSSGLFDGILRVLPVGDSVYIQDVQYSEGIRMSGESIIELDSDGQLKNTVARYLYSERTLQPHIIGLFPAEEGVGYLYKLDDQFRLVRPGEGEDTYPLVNAGLFMRCAAFDPDKGDIYYSTYDGKIFRYVDGVSDALLYSSAEAPDCSIPNEIYFSDGTLYVTDLGYRDVLAIDTKSGKVERYSEDMDFFSKEIAYSLNASNGLVAVTSYSVKKYLGDYSYSYETSCRLTALQKAVAIIAKASLALALLSLAILLVFFTISVFTNGNPYAKLIFGVVLGAVFISGLIISVLIPQFQNRMTEAFFNRAELASTVVSSQVPKEAFVRLDEAEDFMNEDYQAVKKVCTGIFFNESDNLKDLYCCLYQIIDGELVMTYSLKDSVGAIYPYDWDMNGSLESEMLATKTGTRFQSDNSEGEYLFTYDPIIDENDNAVGIIEVGKDMKSYRREVRRMIMDAFVNVLAVTVVLILTVIEIIYYVKGRNEYAQQVAEGAKKIIMPSEITRSVSFMVFFLTNLATAFLPVYAMNIADSVSSLGIPPEVMAAVPISAEVITGAVFSVLGVSMVEKLGEKRAVFVSALLFTGGFVLRIIPSIWMLTLGNAVLGVGWGVILLAVNMRIADLPEDKKDDGFSQYNVAALNGVNCGVVFGGFLVNWVNYQSVFIISAILSLSMLVVTSRYFIRSADEVTGESEEKSGFAETVAFLMNPSVLLLMCMIVVPVMICTYFLNYMYPIIGTDYGLSETYVGYSYLLNGLCVIAFGGKLTALFTFTKKKREGLVVASLLYAVAFFVVVRLHSIPALLFALVLLGISDSFGLPLQSGYYSDLPIVRKFGFGKAFGIYNLVVNVAQAVGPFVFSYVLIAGMGKGLMLVLLILSALALIFGVAGRILDRRGAQTTSNQEE